MRPYRAVAAVQSRITTREGAAYDSGLELSSDAITRPTPPHLATIMLGEAESIVDVEHDL